MTLVEKLKQQPLVLWAFAFYLFSLGFNLQYDIPLALFAMAGVFAMGNVDQHFTWQAILQKHWPVIVFLLITLVVTGLSADLRHSLQVQVQLLPALLMYWTVMSCANKPEQRLFVVVCVILAALVAELSFMGQALYLSEVPDRLEKMWVIKSPLFVAPNDVLFFSVFSPLAIYLLVETGSKSYKILALTYLLLTLVVCIYMQSRQAVGIYLGGLFCLALLWRPLAGVWVVLVGSVLVLMADWLTGQGLLNKLVYLFPRRYVWEAAWQMFLDRPWVGHGPGMFRVLYVEYLEKAGYLLSQLEDRRPMNWAHSLYLEQLAERGLLGLLALAALVFGAVHPLLRSLATVYNKALLACWAGFLAAGIAESSLLRLWAVSGLFLLLSLARVGVFCNKKQEQNSNTI